MSFSPFVQATPFSVTSMVIVEPVYNVLTAMSLLTMPTLDAAKEPWIATTAAKLSPAQRKTNRIVFDWFGHALLPTENHISFANLINTIQSESPVKLRDRVLQTWLESELAGGTTASSLLTDSQHFFAFAKNALTPNVDAGSQVDHELLADVHQLLVDPPVMQALITNHLHTLWESEFAGEWEKKLSMMRYCAEELNMRPWPSESAIALLRAFIGRGFPDAITGQLTGVKQINIVLSPYIHLHASRFDGGNTLWLFMLADFWHLPMRTAPIKRGEVKGPASALADETRLQILELLAAHDELRAQEIIAQLDTSQSTVSRHLKQLSNAQFISEKRGGDANKIYQLNRAKVSEFAHTLSSLLSAQNAKLVLADLRLEQPAALQPYLDRNGLVTIWPAKRKGQQAVLDYLIAKFAKDTKYSEADVNDLLKVWHTYDDPAYLRRSLIEVGLLERTSDGREYWRV